MDQSIVRSTKSVGTTFELKYLIINSKFKLTMEQFNAFYVASCKNRSKECGEKKKEGTNKLIIISSYLRHKKLKSEKLKGLRNISQA